MARGKRPVTFRTRKLSLSAPMVLPRGRGGRVGRRRTPSTDKGPSHQAGALVASPPPATPREASTRKAPTPARDGAHGQALERWAQRRRASLAVAPTLSASHVL